MDEKKTPPMAVTPSTPEEVRDTLRQLMESTMRTREDIADVSANVRALVDVSRRHESRLSAVEGRGRTSPSLVATIVFGVIASFISAVGLCIIIGGLAFTPLNSNHQKLAGEFEMHRDREGHPVVLERVNRLAREAQTQDEREYHEQKELNFWKGQVETTLQALDRRVSANRAMLREQGAIPHE